MRLANRAGAPFGRSRGPLAEACVCLVCFFACHVKKGTWMLYTMSLDPTMGDVATPMGGTQGDGHPQ